jgi:hypothetical protein
MIGGKDHKTRRPFKGQPDKPRRPFHGQASDGTSRRKPCSDTWLVLLLLLLFVACSAWLVHECQTLASMN